MKAVFVGHDQRVQPRRPGLLRTLLRRHYKRAGPRTGIQVDPGDLKGIGPGSTNISEDEPIAINGRPDITGAIQSVRQRDPDESAWIAAPALMQNPGCGVAAGIDDYETLSRVQQHHTRLMVEALPFKEGLPAVFRAPVDDPPGGILLPSPSTQRVKVVPVEHQLRRVVTPIGADRCLSTVNTGQVEVHFRLLRSQRQDACQQDEPATPEPS